MNTDQALERAISARFPSAFQFDTVGRRTVFLNLVGDAAEIWLHDGGCERRLVHADGEESLMYPRLSPCGGMICYSRIGRNPGIEIHIISNSKVQRLTAGRDIEPRWESDGRTVRFKRVRPGSIGRFAVRLRPSISAAA